jgi:hypothetical protein
MRFHPARPPLRTFGIIFTAALLAAGCREGNARPVPALELATYQKLGTGEVEHLQLTKVDSVQFGTSDRDLTQITDLAPHGGRLFVLDGMRKTVAVFDAAGRLERTIGRAGHGPGEFVDPTAIAFAGDTLWVADPASGNRLSAFEPDGRFVTERRFSTPSVPVSLAVLGDRMVTMGVLVPSGPGDDGMNALAVSARGGDLLGRGCRIDPRYVQSRERDGFLAHYDFGSLASDGERLYCTESITPVIQVMDRAGHPLRQIRVAPPFYVPPRDRRMTMNQKAIFDFLGTFTSHARLFPIRGGFISVYSRFDPDAGETRYNLFVCHTSPEARCGVAENVGRPVYVDAAERIYVEEPVEVNQPMRLGIYRIVAGRGQ